MVGTGKSLAVAMVADRDSSKGKTRGYSITIKKVTTDSLNEDTENKDET